MRDAAKARGYCEMALTLTNLVEKTRSDTVRAEYLRLADEYRRLAEQLEATLGKPPGAGDQETR